MEQLGKPTVGCNWSSSGSRWLATTGATDGCLVQAVTLCMSDTPLSGLQPVNGRGAPSVSPTNGTMLPITCDTIIHILCQHSTTAAYPQLLIRHPVRPPVLVAHRPVLGSHPACPWVVLPAPVGPAAHTEVSGTQHAAQQCLPGGRDHDGH